MPFESTPENELTIKVLSELLRTLSVGAVATYSNLNAVVKVDVQRSARPLLDRARRSVEQQDGIRFATVHKIGIKRLASEDIPGIGAVGLKKIGQECRRRFARLGGIKANDITPELQREIDTQRSAFGAISMLTKDRSIEKIKENVTTAGSEIPIGRTFELFTK